MRESIALKTFLNQEEGLASFGCITLFPRELYFFANFLEMNMNYVQHAVHYLS